MLELLKLLKEHPSVTLSFRYSELVGGWQAKVEKYVPIPKPDDPHYKAYFKRVVPLNEHLVEASKMPDTYILLELKGAILEVSAAQPPEGL